ncbi:hypothetical protein glysoja_048654 [Glycine soja]|uniref:Uncharacterized protein n=1 Tax=Glycine soja TaxID=3848 RepID=A0A0B2PMB6_GLYSO|nr:hypothetical protein glysoja_048654 [Glycine soja]
MKIDRRQNRYLKRRKLVGGGLKVLKADRLERPIGATGCRWKSRRGSYRSTGAGGAPPPHQISAPVSLHRSSSLAMIR